MKEVINIFRVYPLWPDRVREFKYRNDARQFAQTMANKYGVFIKVRQCVDERADYFETVEIVYPEGKEPENGRV